MRIPECVDTGASLTAVSARAGVTLPPGADPGQQALRLRRRHRIQLLAQHGAAALIGLHRHPAVAAGGIGPHQRAPGAFMGAIDPQQTLGDGDHRLGVGLLPQQPFAHGAGAVLQMLALIGQPQVEGRIDTVELVQQLALQQVQPVRLPRRGPQHLLHIDPDVLRTQRHMVARHVQDVVRRWLQRVQQAMDLLPQGRAGLLLMAARPQQLCQTRPHHWPRRGKRQYRKKSPRLATDRQDIGAIHRPSRHLTDQGQSQGGRAPLIDSGFGVGVSKLLGVRHFHAPPQLFPARRLSRVDELIIQICASSSIRRTSPCQSFVFLASQISA